MHVVVTWQNVNTSNWPEYFWKTLYVIEISDMCSTGHVFNMPHDNVKACEDVFGKLQENHMMSPTLIQINRTSPWSPCSAAIITEFLDSGHGELLIIFLISWNVNVFELNHITIWPLGMWVKIKALDFFLCFSSRQQEFLLNKHQTLGF